MEAKKNYIYQRSHRSHDSRRKYGAKQQSQSFKSTKVDMPQRTLSPGNRNIPADAANRSTAELPNHTAGTLVKSTPNNNQDFRRRHKPDILTMKREPQLLPKADTTAIKDKSRRLVMSDISIQSIHPDRARQDPRPSVMSDMSIHRQQQDNTPTVNMKRQESNYSIMSENAMLKKQLRQSIKIDMAKQESKQSLVPHIPTGRKESTDSLTSEAPSPKIQTRHHTEVLPLKPNPLKALFMNDGIRRIDFVLVCFAEDAEKEMPWLDTFKDNLWSYGLQLELEQGEAEHAEYHFIKVHATWDALLRCAEVIALNMPVALNDAVEKKTFSDRFWASSFMKRFGYNRRLFPETKRYFVAPFSRAREEEFLIEDRDTFFSDAQRSVVVHRYLSRAEFDPNPVDPTRSKYGYQRLLAEGLLVAAYPLHSELKLEEEVDPNSNDSKEKKDEGYGETESERIYNMRMALHKTWAGWRNVFKFQPLEEIKDYFGANIAIYFCWLGFYTTMLCPIAFVGILATLLGVYNTAIDHNVIHDAVDNICGYSHESSEEGQIVMCPTCDKCHYWKLSQACWSTELESIIGDNDYNLAFTMAVGVWSAVFLKLWKRQTAVLQADWHVKDVEEEDIVRPQFLAMRGKRRPNPVTNEMEPYMSSFRKLFARTSSVSVIMVILSVAMCSTLGIILYREIAAALLQKDDRFDSQNAGIVVKITGAFLNLCMVMCFSTLYTNIAKRMTDYEMPRTRLQWETSYILKMFVFQFANNHAALLYVAFIRDKVVGYPGGYNRILGVARLKECDFAGCNLELGILLAMNMIGRSVLDNIMEVYVPEVKSFVKRKWIAWWKGTKDSNDHGAKYRWEQDFLLDENPELGLIAEYSEIVLQYSLVTMYVAAFPLAPLVALFNNLIEIRIDARKFTLQQRRPIARRAKSIGIWLDILTFISYFGIVTNALLIGFSSQFIQRQIYSHSYSDEGSYNQFRLSIFNTSDYKRDPYSKPLLYKGEEPPAQCRYVGFRHPEYPYDHTYAFWKVLTWSLVFSVLYVLVLGLLASLVNYLVSDIPYKQKVQLKREQYLAKQAMLRYLKPDTIGIGFFDQGHRVTITKSVRSDSVLTEEDG